MRRFWMNSTAITQPVFNWQGEGHAQGDGPGFEDNQGLDQGAPALDANGNPITEGLDNQSEITGDGAFKADEFWKVPDGEVAPPDEDAPYDQATLDAKQQEMVTALDAGIKNFAIPEGAIPEGFDPADPKQFRAVTGALIQQGIRQALNLMFQPVQLSLDSARRQMRAETRAIVGERVEGSSFQTMLERAIPASTNPLHKPVIDVVVAQARRKNPDNPQAAIADAKKALGVMGVNINARAAGGQPRPSEGGKRTGLSALDLFAPLPLKTQTQQTQSRMTK